MLNRLQPQSFPYREHKVCYLSLRAYVTKKTVYLTTYLIMAYYDLTGNHGSLST